MSSTKPVTAAELRGRIEAEADAEDARLKAATAEHQAALAEIRRRNDKIRADHAVAATAARDALKPVPRFPELEDGLEHREALFVIQSRRAANGERRTQLVRDALPDIEAAYRDARDSLDERARRIAADAEALAAEYAGWHGLLQESRRANETTPQGRVVNGPSERMRPRPTAGDVLAAAAGVDLCGVADPRRTTTRDTDGTVEIIEPTRVQVQHPPRSPRLGRR